MADLLEREHLPLKRAGGRFVRPCPFHEEKSASFGTDGQRPYHGHCFGCGWDGSIIDFWMEWRGVDFKTAVEQLGELAGLSPSLHGVSWGTSGRKVTQKTEGAADKKSTTPPALPRMRVLREVEIEQLAALRGLSVQGVRVAAITFRRVGACLWPQYQGRDGAWRASEGAVPSWCVTDDARRCAEFRRLDGKLYPTHSKVEDAEMGRGGDGKTKGGWVLNPESEWIKTWSTRGKSWPLGAAAMGDRRSVILVEGGPDMLAAYHFLWGFRQLAKVAVVAILGASNRIAEDALPYFKRCQVRIFVDADKVKEKRRTLKDGTVKVSRTRPGMDAAARWTEQLCAAGATVKGFDFTDQEPDPLNGLPEHIARLRMIDGGEVKDLNNLAGCNDDVVDHPFIKEAFFNFDF